MIRSIPKIMLGTAAVGSLLFVQLWVTRHIFVEHHHLGISHHHPHQDHDHPHHHKGAGDERDDSHSSQDHQISQVRIEKKLDTQLFSGFAVQPIALSSTMISVQRDWPLPGETLAAKIEPRPPGRPRGPPCHIVHTSI